MHFRSLLLALPLFLAACDSGEVTPPDPEPDPLTLSGQVVGDGSLDLDVPSNAGTLRFDLHSSGLWLGGTQAGQTRVSLLFSEGNTYTLTDASRPPVSVTRESIADVTDWPQDLGAPTTIEGEPSLYGDAMSWGAFSGITAPSPFGSFQAPEGLRVNTAVFTHDRADLAGTLFVRYEITNTSDAAVTSAYAGFYADVDLHRGGEGGAASCFSLGLNRTGFDTSTGLAYTYPGESAGDVNLGCDAAVGGWAFLETPEDVPLVAHRPFYRNAFSSSLDDTNTNSLTAALNALLGLAPDGSPITAPDGVAETFAFTGDPASETGWIDGPNPGVTAAGRDSRALLSAGSFTLGAGEAKILTLVLVLAEGERLSDALEGAKDLVRVVRAEPGLWQFPVAVQS